MKHYHYKELDSTQDTAIKLYSSLNTRLLVSCDLQNKGKGRGSNKWVAQKKGLYFSFSAPPANPKTLTALEMGVQICEYFKQNFNIHLQLKWPNDVFINNKKCGGILLNSFEEKNIIIGIGLNLSINTNEKFFGQIFELNEFNFSQKELCFGLTNFIHQNRLTSPDIKDKFMQYCFHVNKEVKIIDIGNHEGILGQFIGIGEYGEALIQTSLNIEKIFTGSMLIL